MVECGNCKFWDPPDKYEPMYGRCKLISDVDSDSGSAAYMYLVTTVTKLD